MRILSISIDPDEGGSAISLGKLLVGLKKKGVESIVIIPKEGVFSSFLKENEIQYFIIPQIKICRFPRLISLLDYFKFLPELIGRRICNLIAKRKLSKIIEDLKPEIIHTNVSLCIEGFQIAKKYNIPHVWHIREYGDKDFKINFYPSKKYRNYLLKRSVSISITRGIKDFYNLNDDCNVIYNGIKSRNDIDYQSNKSNYFLFVGLINETKGATDLIKAYVEYYNRGGRKRLLLVGRCDEIYRGELCLILQNGNCRHLVEFIDHTNQVDLYMQKAFAIVVPSKYEAFGRVTAEAMFNGCLVIGRNTGGTKEQLDLGRYVMKQEIGLSFMDVPDLSEKMLLVDKMPLEKIESMILAAQQFAKETFSTEKNIDSTYNLFKSLISPMNNNGNKN